MNETRSDWKDVALRHYKELYAKISPEEAAKRCRLPFDGRRVTLAFMGRDYLLEFPEFDAAGLSISEEILVLRYVSGGVYNKTGEKMLSYRELPWGEVYFKNFEGRCLLRFARTFGARSAEWERAMEEHKELGAEKLPVSHPAYRFEFITHLFIEFHLWPGDDEFPASSQILFSDNVPDFYGAEDSAILCEQIINRIKAFLHS